MKSRILAIAREVLSLPTAPFREHAVREYVRGFCRERGIATRTDDMGNVLATFGAKHRNPVFAFAAHMDHPGFIIEKDSVRRPVGARGLARTTALFYGGVEESYFRRARVRVFTVEGEVVGRVTRTRVDLKRNRKRVWLALGGDVKRGEVGMWDLPALRLCGGRMHARACDDLIGCVSVLALFDVLARRRTRRKVLGVFTVAEEGGLHGAKYLAMGGRIPRRSHVIAIETSRELPSARIGRGAVIRVGDRLNVFSPALTRFMEHAARRVAAREKDFRVQRALMDGGYCETSVYQAFGYSAGAVCVPLGNYHNRDFRAKRIAPEIVAVDDLVNMVRLFLGMVHHAPDLPKFLDAPTPLYREERRSLGERLFNPAGHSGRRKR